MGIITVGVFATIIATVAVTAITTQARAGIKEGGPDRLSETQSLGELLKRVQARPVHIVFVHGMRAEGPGASAAFRLELCQRTGAICPPEVTEATRGDNARLDIGPYPHNAQLLGDRIWATQADWLASRPFVDRYVIRPRGGGTVIVDEVNWWPLLFPLKCHFLVKPEVELSGVDKDHLKLCARNDPPFHAWLTQDELTQVLQHHPKSGGGALLNASIKQQILNWGLSDAVIALGSMRPLVQRTMNAAFDFAAQWDGASLDSQEFVVISESLGSFAIMDAFDTDANRIDAAIEGGTPPPQVNAITKVLTRTFDLYFFANQFSLLELGRIEGLKRSGPVPDGIALAEQLSPPSPYRGLRRWARPGLPQAQDWNAAPRYKQIIAFSDPSDLLTFNVPKIDGATVVNLYDRNAFNWFGLFEWPATAHTGHSRNPHVLKVIFDVSESQGR